MNENNGGMEFSYIKDYINDILEKSLGQVDNSKSLDSGNLQKYIQKIMTNSLEQQGFNTANKTNKVSERLGDNNYDDPQFFETHEYIIARIVIPDGVSKRHIKSFTRGNRLFIKWGPAVGDQVIPITFDIDPENVKGIIKDNILEIRFPKEVNIKSKDVEIEYLR